MKETFISIIDEAIQIEKRRCFRQSGKVITPHSDFINVYSFENDDASFKNNLKKAKVYKSKKGAAKGTKMS